MGCDIHAFLEVKIKSEWHQYSECQIDRSYALFSKMAGVRQWDDSDIVPIAEPRGIPKNVSFMTKFRCDYDGEDGHSHSYINSKEILNLIEWCKESNTQVPRPYWAKPEHAPSFGLYLFGNTIEGFEEWPSERPEGIEDIRIVFWFDC